MYVYVYPYMHAYYKYISLYSVPLLAPPPLPPLTHCPSLPQAMYEPSTGDWILLVASVQLRDRGVYECQIGTTPPRSHFVTLHIIGQNFI